MTHLHQTLVDILMQTGKSNYMWIYFIENNARPLQLQMFKWKSLGCKPELHRLGVCWCSHMVILHGHVKGPPPGLEDTRVWNAGLFFEEHFMYAHKLHVAKKVKVLDQNVFKKVLKIHCGVEKLHSGIPWSDIHDNDLGRQVYICSEFSNKNKQTKDKRSIKWVGHLVNRFRDRIMHVRWNPCVRYHIHRWTGLSDAPHPRRRKASRFHIGDTGRA